jgi:hypothetical protein
MAKRNDVTVKVDADVIRDAKLVAVYRGTSVAELLSDILRPIVAKLLEEEQEKSRKAPVRKGAK